MDTSEDPAQVLVLHIVAYIYYCCLYQEAGRCAVAWDIRCVYMVWWDGKFNVKEIYHIHLFARCTLGFIYMRL